MAFDLISPDGRPVSIDQPAIAVRLRAQGYRDAEPELSATEPLHTEDDAESGDSGSEQFVLADHVFVDRDDD
jgi:hypothetical protein